MLKSNVRICRLTVLSPSVKWNGPELTETAEEGITESKHSQITGSSSRRTALRDNEVLDAWCWYKISN